MSEYYDFNVGASIISGRGSVEQLEFFASVDGVTRPLIVTGPKLFSLGIADKIEKSLGRAAENVFVFHEVPNDSSLETVENAYAFYAENNCDGIIAAGGGSVLDTAKGLLLKLTQPALSLKEMMGVDFATGDDVTLIAIPTTAGTGSEATKAAVIFDRAGKRKLEFTDGILNPDLAILDADFLDTLPPKALVSGAFDALTHAIEAYSGMQKNPLSDSFARRAVKTIFADLKIAAEGDAEARQRLLEAADMAGLAFSNSMVGAAHALAHSLGAVSGFAHDLACALVLPEVIRFNSPCPFYGELYKAVTGEVGDGEKFACLIEKFYAEFSDKYGLSANLKSVCPDIDVTAVAELSARDGAAAVNYKPVSSADFLRILTVLTEEKV